MLKRYTGGEWVEQGGGGGTNDYADLSNKPKINNTTLSGNKTSSDLGLQPAINGSAKVNADYIDDSTSTNKFVTAADKTNWNAKLDPGDTYTKQELDDEFTEINNAIDAVESGAAAGATALQPEDVASTYSSSGTAPINGTGVAAALNTLDVPAVGGSGKYLSQISEVDGKIVPVVQTMDSTPTEGSYRTISSDGVRADQQRQETEIGVVANAGAKNLLHFNAIGSGVSVYGKTYTHNGITYTLNADMTVTATGTADSVNNSYAYLILNGSFTPIDDYCDGKHIVSGCPADGSTSKYRMYVTKSGWGSLNETGSGAIIPDKGNYTGLLIACFVSKGYEIPDGEPLVFKPMIRPAAITDGTFVPYALSNPVITPALIEQVDNGAKNKYPPFETQSSRGSTGVTYSYTNGIVHVTGTKSGSLNYIEVVENRPISELGFSVSDTLVLSNTSDSLLLTIILGDGTTFDPAIIVGNGTKELTIGAGKTHIYIRSQVLSSVTGTIDLSATPMICTKAAWDVSHQFEPYALPNPTLTPAAIKAVDEGAKNRAIENTFSNTGNFKQVRISPIITEDFVISIDNITSTDTDASKCAYVLVYTDESTSRITLINRGTAYRKTIANTKEIAAINIYPSDNYNHSKDDTVSVTNLMICSVQDWAISQKYAPYALSNPTLTPALIKQVDEGSKNLSTVSSGIISNSGGGFPIPSTPITVPIGTYIVSFRFSGNATRGSIQFRSGSTTIDSLAFDMAPLVTVQIEITSDTIDNFNLYANSTATISEFMICTLADWNVSQKFVPYAISNAELTAKEEQLENNKLSMAQAYGYDVGYALSGTVDLDNLTTVGVYYYTAATGTTITHAPTSSPFRLEVIQSAGAARYCQFMFANAENALYFRNLVGSTWTGWYKIDATAV